MIAQIPVELETLLGRFGEPLFVIGGTPVTLASVISFAIILAITYGVSKMLQRGLHRVYRQRGVEEGVEYALNRLLHYAILAFGFVWALDNLGVSITGFAALGAILGVGIGFGLQNIAQNFVSGLILLLERPVKRGDFVVVGDTRGTVRAIHMRATVITTLDNVDILVPNGQLITESVVNQTFDTRRVRMRVEVGVAYGSDTDQVRKVLERVAREHSNVLDSPPPTVRFENFGDSSLDFALLAWVADPLQQPQVASDLRFAIDNAFREAGIEIPFPQRDLHIKTSDVEFS